MKKLYLVDVSSMYFRAFYAIRPLSNSKGMPTNALYGFLSMTVKLIKQFQPDYMAYCFDLKGETFRKEKFSDYKANRSEMPEDLVPQVPYVRQLTQALGIPDFSKEGYEADDIIGSFCEFGKKNDLEVVIISGDKDFAQLIGPQVSMYDTMKNKSYDEAGVVEKWGVKTSQFKDYLAIVGDASDNIPGVKGVGPKGAQKLLSEYNDLDEIYQALDKIKNPGMVKKLEAAKDMAFLSKDLVSIVTDLDLVKKVEDLAFQEVPENPLMDLLDELDFQSFKRGVTKLINLKSSENSGEQPDKESDKKTDDVVAKTDTKEDKNEKANSFILPQVIEDEVSVEQLNSILQPQQETWVINNERGIAICPLPSKEKNEAPLKLYRLSGDLGSIGEVLSSSSLKWSGFDIKSVWKSLKMDGNQIQSHSVNWDSMLAAYVVKPGKIDDFEKVYSEYFPEGLSELPSFSEVFQAQWKLKSKLQNLLQEREGTKVYEELELPLVKVLYSMESQGVLLDAKELKTQSDSLGKRIKEVEELIYTEAGETFNIASPKQLAQILFEKMGIEPLKKTKTGYSTNSDVLEKLSKDYKIANYLMEYRELTKLKSTYVDALPSLINQDTARIHTSFFQAHTATGRLSSQHPNLQNIPIRTELGRKIRQAFIVPKGYQLLSIDYSQIELRILAHVTGDEALCSAFQKGYDIHAATASEIYGVALDDVTSEQRRSAKAVNFGIAYGQGAFGLAESLKIPRGEAAEIIKQYFLKFPKVADYMVEIVEKGKSQGFVETIFGRRRYIEELSSSNGRLRKFGERAAINAPIQGAASDIVKKAMIELFKLDLGKMLLQVHDEILFEVPVDQVDSVLAKAQKVMEEVVSLSVPLKVNGAAGDNWDQAH